MIKLKDFSNLKISEGIQILAKRWPQSVGKNTARIRCIFIQFHAVLPQEAFKKQRTKSLFEKRV